MRFKMAFDFKDRRILVIGVSRGGIGPAIAAGFLECGGAVRITGAEPEPIAADQGRYPYTQLDVADPNAVQRLADDLPGLDVLVNCAGIARRDEEYDPAVFARVLEVNLAGLLHVANAFKRHLVASRGAMINIASMYSTFGSPRVPAYGASKAGVAQMTKSLALAWAAQGVGSTPSPPASLSPSKRRAAGPMPRTSSGCSTGRRPAAGASRRTSSDRPCSWPRRRRGSSPAPSCPWTAATPPSNTSPGRGRGLSTACGGHHVDLSDLRRAGPAGGNGVRARAGAGRGAAETRGRRNLRVGPALLPARAHRELPDPEPLVPGHEISGSVAKVGAGVTRVRDGDKVAINPSHACGTCRACRAGRENLCSSMRFLGSASVFPHVQGMFRSISSWGAAVLSDRLGGHAERTGVRRASRGLSDAVHRAGNLLGKSVLVTGAGPIGCLIVMAARLAGAAQVVVTDVVDRTLEVAKTAGADRCLRADQLPKDAGALAEAVGDADVAFEVSGSPAALATCLASVVRGGRIVQVGTLPADGLQFPANQVMVREIDYVGTFRFGVEFDWAVRYLTERRVDVQPLLSAQYPLQDAEAAFRLASDKSRSVKVQLVVA